MKKLVMFAVAALVALTGFSATVDDLFNYVEKQGGTVMDLPKEMMAMMMQQQGGKEAEALKNIKHMKMGMMESATAAQRAGFQAIAEEGVDGYLDMDTLMASMGQKIDNEGVKIFMQMDSNTEKFTSFLIVTLKDEDGGMGVIQMDGDLTLDDLGKMN